MERHIQTIGILTSGGDSPGMNAAIRAVTRTARFHKINVIGIVRGYQGLIDKEFLKFTSSSVSNTIQRGGTILKTARSQEFMTPEGRRKAYDNMVEAGIDAPASRHRMRKDASVTSSIGASTTGRSPRSMFPIFMAQIYAFFLYL